MSIEVLASIGFVAFSGLTGIIYNNLRNGIKCNKDDILRVQTENDEWKSEDEKFKLKVTDSLARL